MANGTVVDVGMWRRLGLAFLVMTAGLGLALVGLGWDFYAHQIVGLSAGDESLLAPPHLAIFGGIGVTALGYLLAHRALKRHGFTPFRMMAA